MKSSGIFSDIIKPSSRNKSSMDGWLFNLVVGDSDNGSGEHIRLEWLPDDSYPTSDTDAAE